MFRILPHRAFIEPKATLVRAEPTPEGEVASLRIEGLLCSACAANVCRRLEAVPGVREARVDLERGEAEVRYDPGLTRPDSLVAAVEGAVLFKPLRRLLAALGGRLAAQGAH